MSELSREALLRLVRRVWEDRDPMPEGLIERMQAVAAAEALLEDSDLDYELLLLVERSHELAGTRGEGRRSTYTLQYRHEELSLLLRVAGVDEDSGLTRLDGWLAPPAPMLVRIALVDVGSGPASGLDGEWQVEVDERGRFEFADLPPGLYRLWLSPHDGDQHTFATPAFEI